MRALLLLVSISIAGCSNIRLPPDQSTRFQLELDRVQAQFSIPGITAAYVLSDGTVASAASGLADIEARIAMQENTRMLAASIGKSFVATLCIALAQEGRLTLDEPVSRWLGSYDWFEQLPNHQTISLRHLLTHSSGLADHVYMPAFTEALANTRQSTENPFPPERLVQFILNQPALFPAGHGWAYSDTNYILAGLVIEAVTEQTYYKELHQRLLEPLALYDTTPANQRKLDRLAAGYMRADNLFRFPVKTIDQNGYLQWHPAVEWTGGGLISTSRDLARWGHVLFTGQAMSDDYLAELLKGITVEQGSSNVQYAAGVAIYSDSCFGPVYGHAGWIPGYTSSLRYYPEYGVSIAFQINTDIGIIDSDSDTLASIENRLMRALMQRTKCNTGKTESVVGTP
jgi:D-alanyl-D-alanine carboxypeptidase